MWVFTNKGFFSIVEDRDNANNHLVRARMKGDLERLFAPYFAFPKLQVEETPDADYRFRVSLHKSVVTNAIGVAVDEIDYDNFKNSYRDNEKIPHTLRSLTHYHMHDVWSAMHEAQEHGKSYEEAEDGLESAKVHD
tara:strand:- start:2411 stop:2818 length:408 start_codon:yes stop_codon:yes gene_type:complete